MVYDKYVKQNKSVTGSVIAALMGLACLGFAAFGEAAEAEPIDAYREMLLN